MRRIVLVLILLGVLGAGVGGGWWWLHRNQGEKLLARAELALQAGNFDRAADLARRYAAEAPEDWRARYCLAEAQVALGRFEEARRALDDAAELAPGEPAIVLLKAATYSRPARDLLGLPDPNLPLETIRSAIAQLETARDLLREAPAPSEPKAKADLAQALGLVMADLGEARRRLGNRLAAAAEVARQAGASDQAAEKQAAADQAHRQADADFAEATRLLAEAVQAAAAAGEGAAKAAVPARAADALVRLCIDRGDEETLTKVRPLILGAEDPPLVAATLLLVHDLGELDPDTIQSPQRREAIQAVCKRLDALIERHGDRPEALVARLRRARLALVLGDLETAESLCDAILKDLPRQEEARLIRALVDLRRGRLAEAEKALFALKTDAPAWPAAHYYYARAAMLAGKDELAREALRTTLNLQPDHFEARRLFARSLLDDGFNKEALNEAQVLYRTHPDRPEALLLLVEAAYKTDQSKLAREAVARAARDHPDDPAMQAAVAEAYAMLGEAARARSAAEAAARLSASTPTAACAVARSLVRLGRLGEAEALLARTVKEAPDSAYPRFLLGGVFLARGQNLAAVEQFRKALALDPLSHEFRLALAQALVRSAMLEEAEEHLRTILARDPANERAALLLAQVQATLGKEVGGEALLQGALAGKGERLIAQTYLARGEAGKCAELCEALLREAPNDPDALWLLGRARLALGDREAAVRAWTKALEADPDRLPVYPALAAAMLRDRPLAEVEAAMKAVPGARPALVHLATASVLERLRRFEAAAEAYDRVAASPDTSEALRASAYIRKGRCLASAGHADLATLEFDRVPSASPLRSRAMLAKAAVLAAADRVQEAQAVLEAVRKKAVEDRDGDVLQRVGMYYVGLNQAETALAVADEAAAAAPNTPGPLLLKAQALARLNRTDEALTCYREAIDLRPADLGLRVRLVRALDAAGRCVEALAALDDLAALGSAGRTVALYERGVLLARWGLYRRAADTLSRLAEDEPTVTPALRLVMGRALAALGRADEARRWLAAIPPYSPQFVEARLRLADLAESDEAKLDLLQKAEAQRPSPLLTARRIDLLTGGGRTDEALALLADHLKSLPAGAPPHPVVAAAGLRAYLVAKNVRGAIDFARRVAQTAGSVQYRRVAALLAARLDPATASDPLPPPQEAPLTDALIGLYRAARAGTDAASWAVRVETLARRAAESGSAGAFPTHYAVLAALVRGDPDAASASLEALKAPETPAMAAMRELVATVRKIPDARNEAAALLGTAVAMDLGLRDLARGWALEVLRKRPQSQWAALLAARDLTDADRLQAVADLVQPADGLVARLLRLAMLQARDQFDEAAKLATTLAEAHPDDMDLRMQQAMALERAGRFEEALAVYRTVWEKAKNPVAANNAAYLLAHLHGKEPERLREALALADAAVQAAPAVASFLDTRGWIAHLLGRGEEACRSLRRAVRGQPDSPEVHAHLGLAERKAGHTELARWHLEAAVALAEARGDRLTRTETDALALARAALAELGESKKP